MKADGCGSDQKSDRFLSVCKFWNGEVEWLTCSSQYTFEIQHWQIHQTSFYSRSKVLGHEYQKRVRIGRLDVGSEREHHIVSLIFFLHISAEHYGRYGRSKFSSKFIKFSVKNPAVKLIVARLYWLVILTSKRVHFLPYVYNCICLIFELVYRGGRGFNCVQHPKYFLY